jgi:hypothetical protein
LAGANLRKANWASVPVIYWKIGFVVVISLLHYLYVNLLTYENSTTIAVFIFSVFATLLA